MASKNASLNFNTKQMKVAFFDVADADNFQAMDAMTMGNLLKAAQYAVHRSNLRGEGVRGFVVVSPSLRFGDTEAAVLASHLKKQGVKILSSDDQTFVSQTKKGHTVSFKVVGGSRYGGVSSGTDDDSSSSGESSYEEMNNKGLTQECQH